MQALFSFLQNGAVYVVSCVILLGVLIFIHELGHFLVARWCGVRVEVFSLGFGKKLWKKTVGDTTYAISAIPLGGYVKMFGEQPGEEIAEAEKAVSFTHKTVWQRIAIVLAGPLMNLFFAAILFMAVAMLGIEHRAPALGDLDADSIAAKFGFKSGDKIVSVDGRPVETYEQVSNLMDENIGRKLSFKVMREDGSEADIAADIVSTPNPNPLSLRETVGEIEGLTALSRAPIVGVPKDSPLWALGLRTGDRIVGVGDRKISYYRELDSALTTAPAGPLVLEVERAANSPEGYAKPKIEASSMSNGAEKFTLTAAMDVRSGLGGARLESSELYLSEVVPGSPADKAGLKNGDRLVALNGKPVLRWEDVLNTIKGYDGQSGVLVNYIRDGEAQTLKLEPLMTSQMTVYGGEDKRYTIGIKPSVEVALPPSIIIRELNPAVALVKGAQQSWEFSVITVLSFVRLFENKISPKTVGGLLSIGQAAGETMKMGVTKFLTMMAIISINLFVLNLLPVPVLDGGHLVFYTIEVIKGSPLSLKKMQFAQQIGMFMLMALMVFALYNDVTRFFFSRT